VKSFIKKSWIGAVVFGVVLLVAGGFMIVQGRQAHDDVRDTLADEKIISSQDADIPLAEVDTAAEAKAQADAIHEHALEASGGKTYAEMDRDDPNRAVYLNSVTLRTALMESYMAFKVSDLVSGVGLIVALLGVGQIALGIFLALVVRTEREQELELKLAENHGSTA
jgi:hypothetical protein